MEIINKLKEILITYFNFSENTNWNDFIQVPLTSKKIGFDSIILYYFLMKIEEEFEICFTYEDLTDKNFYTLNNIANTIQKKLLIING